jgi:hypothetical protein
MGFETAEVLEESGSENQGQSIDLTGKRITMFSANVHGADVNDPRLADLCHFLQSLVIRLNAPDTDMPIYATQESVNELLDIVEARVVTELKLVFAWNGIIAVCEETETLSMLLQLLPYEFADIFGYSLQ